MTLVSKLSNAMYSEPGYGAPHPVGLEDVYAAQAAGLLIEHCFGLPGHFWEMIQWKHQMCIYGKGILEESWEYSEAPRNMRSIGIDPIYGDEVSQFVTMRIPVWDDPRMRVLSVHGKIFGLQGLPARLQKERARTRESGCVRRRQNGCRLEVLKINDGRG